ncbi:hypothetical protein HPB52_025250 [Rhipicephalus sanguineus]|uniref:DDE Tnp4 domain-containing protein n=1 Tax=Rhipicephalus sanguineus TaxID=34632 RepID=A0A9D4TD99_RHISA|nr:hypothetical protein HPB52_025250 [Rhipicephalus sanguineus]
MAFRVGIETARNVIIETCTVLWEVLSPGYMKTPTEQDWREIADGFCSRWQFPNCLGAVDGKHIQIKCPRNAGSMYFNYKTSKDTFGTVSGGAWRQGPESTTVFGLEKPKARNCAKVANAGQAGAHQSAYQQTHDEIFDNFILAHNGLVTPAEPASAQQGHQPSDRS